MGSLIKQCILFEIFSQFSLLHPIQSWNAGARFSKVPIINGPGKLSPFTLKIEVSIVLHLTRQNCQLMKQNAVVCQPGPELLFFKINFDLNIWFRAR